MQDTPLPLFHKKTRPRARAHTHMDEPHLSSLKHTTIGTRPPPKSRQQAASKDEALYCTSPIHHRGPGLPYKSCDKFALRTSIARQIEGPTTERSPLPDGSHVTSVALFTAKPGHATRPTRPARPPRPVPWFIAHTGLQFPFLSVFNLFSSFIHPPSLLLPLNNNNNFFLLLLLLPSTTNNA